MRTSEQTARSRRDSASYRQRVADRDGRTIRPLVDLTGKRFGRLTVVSLSGADKFGSRIWRCRCECGGETEVRSYSLRRGHTQSCGCLTHEQPNHSGRSPHTRVDAAWSFKFLQYQGTAKNRRLDWVLTFDDFKRLCAQACHYCGAEPEVRRAQRSRAEVRASGLDRVDNSQGYTLENTVACCTWCNRAKNDYTAEEFVNHCIRVANAAIARHE